MHRAIVTGGSRGIGRAIAGALAADGGRVMITGLDRTRLDAAVDAIAREAGDASRVAGTVADVRDPASVEALVRETARQFGGLDTLVNNAGTPGFEEVATMTADAWRRVIDTNLSGPFYCAHAAIPELRKAGGGWIINIASLAARNAFAGGAAYCASKAGLVAFSESLMQEVRYDGIRVSVVLPGSVATGFSGRASSSGDDWKLAPADVAEAVMDLLRHPGRSLPSRVEIRPSKPKSRT
jgi:NAD(P)-dependent dehydrogenase (short-subunit alcohol dehydrogenase family)